SDGPTSGQPSGWYWLVSQGTPIVGTINTLAHAFNPSPFSNDLYYTFGGGSETGLVGHWDPQLPLPGGALDATPPTSSVMVIPPLAQNPPVGHQDSRDISLAWSIAANDLSVPVVRTDIFVSDNNGSWSLVPH